MKIADVNLADNISGPEIGAIKVKITGIKSKPVKDEVVEIPAELIEQHIYLIQ